MKTFKLRFDDVEQVITEKAGAAVASDRIAVDGEPVRVMERTTPCEATDSGWLFLAGDETPAALRNRRTFGVYHLNHLANHTPAIVPFLWALPGQRFTFNRRRGAFVEARDSKPDLPAAKLPKGITVQGPGRVDLEANWSLDLSSPFRRRFEDESHVFWRPLMTVWVYGVARRTPLSELKARLLTPTAYDVSEKRSPTLHRLRFRVPRPADGTGSRCDALHAVALGPQGYLHFAVYCDRELDLADAASLVDSVRSSR